MARVTSDGQTRASKTSPLMSQTSHLRDIRQTGCDVMSVLVSQEADVLLANLAYGHDRSGNSEAAMGMSSHLLHSSTRDLFCRKPPPPRFRQSTDVLPTAHHPSGRPSPFIFARIAVAGPPCFYEKRFRVSTSRYRIIAA